MKEKDLSKRFTITGVNDASKIRKDFWNVVNNPEKVNVNLLRDEDVETVEMDGKMVVAIRVPRADYNTRPVFINNNPLRGTFIRNHEGDYHCPEELVTMMMRDANHDGNAIANGFITGTQIIRSTISTTPNSCGRWVGLRRIARAGWNA